MKKAIHGGYGDLLINALTDRFAEKRFDCELLLDADQGQIRAVLFEEGVIVAEEYLDNGQIRLRLKLSESLQKRLCRRFQLDIDRFQHATDTLAGAA